MPVIGLYFGGAGCQRPKHDLSAMPNASEICFNYLDLGLKIGDIVPETIRVAYRDTGTQTWHFNKGILVGAVGEELDKDKYCYVYNPDGQYPVI